LREIAWPRDTAEATKCTSAASMTCSQCPPPRPLPQQNKERGCAKPFPPASYIAVLLRDASAFFVVHGALKDTNSFSTTDSLITKGSWNWENAASPMPQALLHIQDDNTHGGFNVCASPGRQSRLRQQRWCYKRRALRCGAGFCCWHLVGLPSDSSSGPSRCRGALARLFRPARPQMPQTKGRTRGQAYDAEWMNSFHNTCSNARHVVCVRCSHRALTRRPPALATRQSLKQCGQGSAPPSDCIYAVSERWLSHVLCGCLGFAVSSSCLFRATLKTVGRLHTPAPWGW
jgi:hypothetical protein